MSRVAYEFHSVIRQSVKIPVQNDAIPVEIARILIILRISFWNPGLFLGCAVIYDADLQTESSVLFGAVVHYSMALHDPLNGSPEIREA